MMKNEYSFSLLEKRALTSREDEAEVFMKMLGILEAGIITRTFDEPSELYKELPSGDYYIAHNFTVRNGRKKIFKGRVFISKKNNLISFLGELFKIDDIRCFLVSPVSNELEYVFYIDGEQLHSYHR